MSDERTAAIVRAYIQNLQFMSLASIDRIEDILAQKEEVSGSYTGDNEYSGKDVITFENVGFSYGTKNVLDGVNLSIEWDDDIGLWIRTGNRGGAG